MRGDRADRHPALRLSDVAKQALSRREELLNSEKDSLAILHDLVQS